MAILDELNTLQSNIGTAKQLLAANINSKGVSTVTSANTLTELANAILNIECNGDSGNIDNSTINKGNVFDFEWTKGNFDYLGITLYDTNYSSTNVELTSSPTSIEVDIDNIVDITSTVKFTKINSLPALKWVSINGIIGNYIGEELNISNLDLSNSEENPFNTSQNNTYIKTLIMDNIILNKYGYPNYLKEYFKYLPNIEKLSMKNFDAVGTNTLSNFYSNLPNLVELDVTGWVDDVTSLGQTFFSNNSKLKKIILGNVSEATYNWWKGTIKNSSSTDVTIIANIIV